MSDLKSKLPDVKELTSMANKLYKGIKTSICEIIDDYKKKREQEINTPEKPEDQVKAAQEDVVITTKSKKKNVEEKITDVQKTDDHTNDLTKDQPKDQPHD